MADWITKISDTATGGTLNQQEMENNALAVREILGLTYGWSLAAIAGALGNMQAESTLNPGACEIGRGIPQNGQLLYGGGLGLIQWTDYPAYSATKPHPLLWYADHVGGRWYDGDLQCNLLLYADDPTITSCGLDEGPRWGWQTSSSYPSISFDNYKNFDGSADEAAVYWFYDMEWHYEIEDGTLAKRKENALNWYTFLGGQPVRKRKGMPIWMMLRKNVL